MGLRLFRYAVACLFAALSLPVCLPARAEDHLPSIDIQPVATWAGAGKARDLPGSPLVNGDIGISGTVLIPIFKGFSAAYDRISNGVYHNTFDRVIIPAAGFVQPGRYNDIVQQYRFDEQYRHFTLEGGAATRHRVCCPASGDPNGQPSTEWHQIYLGLTYTTHPIDFLHNSVFVFNVTGHSAKHDPSPQALGFEQALSPGIVDIAKHEYGSTQAATLVVPVDAKHRFTTTGTYTWGAFDYFENYPYPLNYGIWVFTANKRFNNVFGIELREANLWQRPNQNTPFPSNAIHVIDWSLLADFHLNLNHLGR